jgi:hypothetical protein
VAHAADRGARNLLECAGPLIVYGIPKPYRFTLTIPACVTVDETGMIGDGSPTVRPEEV